MNMWLVTPVLLCLFLSVDGNREYTIGFLPAMNNIYKESTSSQYGEHKGKTYAGALTVALDDLSKDPSYNHINFKYMYNDTLFDLETTLKAMVEMNDKNVDVFIGPENECKIPAKLASALNLPIIGFKCLDSELSDKSYYETFARTVPGTAKVSRSILALMKYYNWESFSVVMQRTDEWAEVSRTLARTAKANNIRVNTNDTIRSNFRLNEESFNEICDVVRATSNHTRVYIVLGEHDLMVRFMECLSSMTDITQHAVIHIRSFDDTFDYTDPEALRKLVTYWINNETSSHLNPDNIRPFAQLITVLHRQSAESIEYQRFVRDVRRDLHEPPFNVPKLPGEDEDLRVSIYAAKVYDAVMLYARAVNRTLNKGGDPRNGRELMKEMFNTTFISVQNFTDTIDENGDSEGGYSTVAVVKNATDPLGWSVKLVGTFMWLDNDTTLRYELLSKMSWLGNVPISDPVCGFKNEKCLDESNQHILIIVTVICSSIIIILAIVALCSWRYYVQLKQIESLLWKLEWHDIEEVQKGEGHIAYTESDALETTELISKSSGSVIESASEKLKGIKWQFLEDDSCSQKKLQLPYYTDVGYYKKMLVSIKGIRRNLELDKKMKRQLHLLRELNHENLNKFIGVCIEAPNIYIVTQYCTRGSLEDVLDLNRDLLLEDTMLKFSLINDLVKGMLFIHESSIGYHGSLRTTKCLVNSRWVLQINGFGLNSFEINEEKESYFKTEKYYRGLIAGTLYGVLVPGRTRTRPGTFLISNESCQDVTGQFADMLWRAPELLRDNSVNGSAKADVYSFGIVLHEILGLMGPWGQTQLLDRDIVAKVKAGRMPYLRPNMSFLNCDDYLMKCMEDCWNESPEGRPDFKTIHDKRLKPLNESLGPNILENMWQRLETYTKNLESLVEERTYQFKSEKKKTEKLLHRMLPKSVAEDLKKGKPVQASYYECVTVYFSDIVGFTKLCSESDPYQIVKFLNDLYTNFDGIINNYDVYKVETIGDAYMVVSGLPKQNGDNHAGEIASMSLHILRAMMDFQIHHRPNEQLKIRIGIHSGPVAVGVVGIKMPRYCLFGDTVNTTSRMESNGQPLMIHCSAQCKAILDKLGGYQLESRGLVEMKGKGAVMTYWLVGEDSLHRLKRLSENQSYYGCDSACTSTRSSINESLYLMPNGFRRPKITRDHFSLDEFKLKLSLSKSNSTRRGSMPINDLKRHSMGLLEFSTRREQNVEEIDSQTLSSTPLAYKRLLNPKWDIAEDDEKGIYIESQMRPIIYRSVRASPEGCDSEPESAQHDREESLINNNPYPSLSKGNKVDTDSGTCLQLSKSGQNISAADPLKTTPV